MAVKDRFLERLIKRGTLTLIRPDGSSRTFGVADPAQKDGRGHPVFVPRRDWRCWRTRCRRR